jgi:hypothetical protein
MEIISEDGLSRFSSDRGLRGQPAPAEWLAAMRISPEGWFAVRHDERSIGLPLHDAQGHTTQHLVLTFRDGAATAGESRTLTLVGVAGFIAIAALAVLCAGEWRRNCRRRLEQAAIEDQHPVDGVHPFEVHPLGDAPRQLAEVRAALDAAAARARAIAGASP